MTFSLIPNKAQKVAEDNEVANADFERSVHELQTAKNTPQMVSTRLSGPVDLSLQVALADLHNYKQLEDFGATMLFRITPSISYHFDPMPQGNWQYTMKRTGTMIFPFLYLGPSSVIKDKDFLRDKDINCVVYITTPGGKMPKPSTAHLQPMGIKLALMDCSPHMMAHETFMDIIRGTNEHITSVWETKEKLNMPPQLGTVLLASNEGEAQANLAAMAYIMAMFRKPAEQALGLVQSKRACATISRDDMNVLRAFEDILDAKMNCSAAGNGAAHYNPAAESGRSYTPKRKRAESVDDEVMDTAYPSFVPDANGNANPGGFSQFFNRQTSDGM